MFIFLSDRNCIPSGVVVATNSRQTVNEGCFEQLESKAGFAVFKSTADRQSNKRNVVNCEATTRFQLWERISDGPSGHSGCRSGAQFRADQHGQELSIRVFYIIYNAWCHHPLRCCVGSTRPVEILLDSTHFAYSYFPNLEATSPKTDTELVRMEEVHVVQTTPVSSTIPCKQETPTTTTHGRWHASYRHSGFQPPPLAALLPPAPPNPLWSAPP